MSDRPARQRVLIAGGGLAGSMMALVLASMPSMEDTDIVLVERRADPSTAYISPSAAAPEAQFVGLLSNSSRRTINLGLSARGEAALRTLGLRDAVTPYCVPFTRRVIHIRNQPTREQFYSDGVEAIQSVSRSQLSVVLWQQLRIWKEKTGRLEFRFNTRVTNVTAAGEVTLVDDSGTVSRLTVDLVIGADGAFSAVRASMMKLRRVNFSQQFFEHGYKEVFIPAGPDGDFLLKPVNAFHVFPKGNYFMQTMPNYDGTITGTLFAPYTMLEELEALDDAALTSWYTSNFPELVELVPDIIQQFRDAPSSSLVTVRVQPWNYGDKVLLIGDAAHAMLPFFGQGMNSAFDDCMKFRDLLLTPGMTLSQAVLTFAASRPVETNAAATLSERNYWELSAKTADPSFVLRKRVDFLLHSYFPTWWRSVNSLMFFSTEPYSLALKVADYQEAMLKSFFAQAATTAKVEENRAELAAALKADLGVNDFWVHAIELAGIVKECKALLSGLPSWIQPVVVSTPLLTLPASSSIVPEPYGVCLIIGPWNYPLSLLLQPMAAAFAAGNAVFLKPSEVSVNASAALARLLPRYLDPAGFAVLEGGPDETKALLKEKFDAIMYTGSTSVGRIVMSAAAVHLTPVLLELGGKCPAIIADDADLEIAARRIAWAKWSMNNGQTCLSPDYVITTPANRDKVVAAIKAAVISFYGEDPSSSPDISRMINERHTQRVAALLKDDSIRVVHGGDVDVPKRYISPTIVLAAPSSKVMEDEIFGPVLPVLTLPTLQDAVQFVADREKPLAVYVFTKSAAVKRAVLEGTSSGGLCVNDAIVHAANAELPFGGVGNSGMGAYHGKHGFDAFSHRKSVLEKYYGDSSLRFPPYTPDKVSKVRAAGGLTIAVHPTHVKFSLFALAAVLAACGVMRFGRSSL